MRRIVILMISLCVSLPGMMAFTEQLSSAGVLVSDPQDRIYEHLDRWEKIGYIRKLPPLRPYSLQFVLSCLSQVLEQAQGEDRDLARSYDEALRPAIGSPKKNGTLASGMGVLFTDNAWSDLFALRMDALLGLTFQGRMGDLFSFSGRAMIGLTGSIQDYIPPRWTPIGDESRSGGGKVPFGDTFIESKHLGLGSISIGTADLWFQAGIVRSSFGPFDDGPVISPECQAQGHFSFVWMQDWFTASSALLVLNGKFYEDPATGLRKEFPSPPLKYLAIHSFAIQPFRWLELGVIQTNLFGGQFNPLFLVPFQHLFFTQQLYSDQGSTFLGFFGRFHAAWFLEFDALLYVDDFSVNRFLGEGGYPFNLDSAQNKLAFEAGCTVTTGWKWLSGARLTYLAVTPYTYTHSATLPINYLSYTMNEQNVGTVLEPNSDQLLLTLSSEPAPWLDGKLFVRFVRHGNASEGYAQGDGTVFDDGYDALGPTFFGASRFLKQAVIEKTLHIGIQANLRFGLGWSRLTVSAGYTFEYIWDRKLLAGDNYATFQLHMGAAIEW